MSMRLSGKKGLTMTSAPNGVLVPRRTYGRLPRRGRAVLATFGVALIIALTQAGSAAAVWDGHCKFLPSEDHCYGLAEWNMKSPEHVRGGVLFMTTTYQDVYDWNTGAFIDNEMWVSWKGTGNWLESGQTVGNGKDCCTIDAFWAYEHNGNYAEFVAGAVPQKTNHYIIEDPAENGNWCIYWGNYVLQRCFSGWFPASANQLESGLEAATDVKPSNEAVWEVAYVDSYGNWHPWKGSLTESHFVSTAANICVGPYVGAPPGDGFAWTC
jgi:hypothetical protein